MMIYIRLTLIIAVGYDASFFRNNEKKTRRSISYSRVPATHMHSIVIPYPRCTTCVFCTQRVDHGFCKTSTLTNSFVNLF